MSDHSKTSEAAEPPVTARDISDINVARRALSDMASNLWRSRDADEVRLLVKIEAAQDALFQVFNTANAYCHVPINYTDMHDLGVPKIAEPVPVPQSLKAQP
jgi:hypothetical protein